MWGEKTDRVGQGAVGLGHVAACPATYGHPALVPQQAFCLGDLRVQSLDVPKVLLHLGEWVSALLLKIDARPLVKEPGLGLEAELGDLVRPIVPFEIKDLQQYGLALTVLRRWLELGPIEATESPSAAAEESRKDRQALGVALIRLEYLLHAHHAADPLLGVTTALLEILAECSVRLARTDFFSQVLDVYEGPARLMVIRALGRVGQATESYVRGSAVHPCGDRVIAARGAALDMLRERALEAEHPELHNDLFFGLYNFRGDAVPIVRAVCRERDDDPSTLLWGARLLGLIGEGCRSAVDDLLSISRENDPGVVGEVMMALLRIAPEDPRVLDRLRVLATLPNGEEFEELLRSHLAHRPH